jgi:cell division initiation protein
MTLTPVELRHVKLRRGLFGYRPRQTDELLEETVASFEDVWRDRADLTDKVEQLEEDLVRYKELEALLRTTLVSAERAATDMKERAAREAELILSEAHAESRRTMHRATTERERLLGDVRRIRAQLQAALASIATEEQPPKESAPEVEAA